MRVLVQRIKKAKIRISDTSVAEIEKGMLLFVAIGKEDSDKDIEFLSRKVVSLRIFEDKDGKMNLSVKDINGQILSVPQFTLYADTSRGNRPGFELSAGPGKAKECWERFNVLLKGAGVDVKEGVFGAHMEVELVNDGPVTIWLDSRQ